MLEYIQTVSGVASGIIYVIILGFLIGLVRESSSRTKLTKFGGVRTYPLISLIGFLLFIVDDAFYIPFITGFVLIGIILAVYYHYHLHKGQTGIISELTAMITYIIGGLAARGDLWEPLAVTIVVILLIQSRVYLENLAMRIPPHEIATFIKFLLLSIVILPVFPDQNYTQANLNPFRIWLLVVVVNGFSYISYLVQLFLKGRGGLLIFSILGGAYSSTVTTIVLARQLKNETESTDEAGKRFAGIIMASSIMYLRILLLVLIFNSEIILKLAPPFGIASLTGIIIASIIYARKVKMDRDTLMQGKLESSYSNPLDLGAALLFAILFVAVTVGNHFLKGVIGNTGIYALSVIMGITDVDPFILSVIQKNDGLTISVMVLAIILAAASNNLLKGFYTYIYTRNRTGLKIIAILSLLSAWSIALYFIFELLA
ncbi:MAG: DUF4010 domain-containing protein [Spirochaetes bacterium]|jgi:uncharacterized membrane protein (DUF4010 family)|nr:DUF4010 domain-containing protein [Spirochaetota bacterium]